MKVAVYWNLHKHCFSLQSREKGNYGQVVDHCPSVALYEPEFVVRQAGRERVLKEGKKNVHAFVVGFLEPRYFKPPREWFKVLYNPYKFNSFVIADTKEQVLQGSLARLYSSNNKPTIEVTL